MPVQPTYPGVYIEELPSGVRTIAGVSTSVAAFVGTAKRGPINKAVHILSYADFERRFGGLASDSELSYAVRQFFLNGGTDSWVVRLAGNPTTATKTLRASGGTDVLDIRAFDEGSSGNQIEVRVSHETANPASNFDLTVLSVFPESPSDSRTEVFENLSMNSKDPRYVIDVVNSSSQLIRAERKAGLNFTGKTGTSTSGELTDVRNLVDPTHNRLLVSVNSGDPVNVTLNVGAIQGAASANAAIDLLCTQIQTQVAAQAAGFTCAANAGKNRIIMTSGQDGEESSVRVLPAPANDVSSRLKLGTAQGGVEKDAAADFRPLAIPDPGSIKGGVIAAEADLAGIPAANARKLQIGLDGAALATIDIGDAALPAGLTPKLENLAGRIEAAVRALRPSEPAYEKFRALVDGGNSLVLRSGTRGAKSEVEVVAVTGDDLATKLKLLTGAGATVTPGKAEMLTGGSEGPITPATLYATVIGDRAKRTGIFALEGVDLFNLLCLPGITSSGVLADAESYCRERRAFLIIDAPPDSKDPAAMVTTISGTALPKSDHAAVYYPWVRIADPLKAGMLRTTAPCGTIAGLYARIDASRGVWKAPAGTEATLTGVLAVEHNLTDRENGTLNPLGVNCIRVLPVFGAVSWGARTLRGADAMTSEWKYIPVRRLALYIEESLYRGTQWVVFEPNDEPLWSQIRLNVGAFMNTLFRQGAFQGSTPREAYLVKCDRDTTTQDDINRGIVNIVVGFAPLKPAEFVIIKIQQLAGQVQA